MIQYDIFVCRRNRKLSANQHGTEKRKLTEKLMKRTKLIYLCSEKTAPVKSP